MKNDNNDQLLVVIKKLNDKIAELKKSKDERHQPIINISDSEQNFKALVESARDAIIVIQNDVIKFANQHASKMYDKPLSEIVGQSFLKFVHTDSIDNIKKRYADWRNGKKVPNYFEVDLINATEEKRICEINSSIIVFDGQSSELVIIHDITERKRVEKVLLESKANVIALLENTKDSIWAINTSYKILYSNAVFTSEFDTSFGVHLESGVNLLMALPEPMRLLWKSRYDRVLNNDHFSIVDKIELKNGSIYIEVFMNPIIVAGRVIGASFFGRDITNRRKSEKKLKSRNKELELFNEVTVDRELKMLELKKEINELLEKSGEKPKYKIPT